MEPSEPLGVGIQTSDNGLLAAVQELSGRLTREEALVLEMTSQLVSVLTDLLLKQSLKPGQPPEDDFVRHTPVSTEEIDHESVAIPRKSWWSRFLKSGQ